MKLLFDNEQNFTTFASFYLCSRVMMKLLKSGHLSTIIISLLWGSGAILAMRDACMILNYPLCILKARAIVLLYVLFLFENAVSYMEILAQDRAKKLGIEAIKSLFLLNLGTAVCFLCLLTVILMQVDWPNWIILCAAILMKYQVELFKMHSDSFFEVSIYSRQKLES